MRSRAGLIALVSACVLAVAGSDAASAAWAPVGSNAVNGDVASGSPSLVTIAGAPYVATYGPDANNNSEIFVRRLSAAGTWEAVGGASRVKNAPDGTANQPSLANVGGVPHVAYIEWNGVHDEVRVSRLDPTTGQWEQVVGGERPISHTDEKHSYTPSLASVGGVPYVAWNELSADASSQNVWVSRLNAAGTAWEPVGGNAPVNAPGFGVNSTKLFVIDGVPYVAYNEQQGLDSKIRVARLNADGTGWENVGGPIRHAANGLAFRPSLGSVDGVPYLAWSEADPSDNFDVRVVRLNAAGTEWEEVGDRLDHTPDDDAVYPDLLAIGGVPFVAWTEEHGNFEAEVHISRLGGAGTAWQEVAGGPSPIPHGPDGRSAAADLGSIGGVPYLATEDQTPPRGSIRVSRLEPEFLDQAAFATDHAALVFATVRTYGVRYPIAFQYGQAALTHRTGTALTARDSDVDTVFRVIPGLAPDTDYLWRAIGFDGFRATGSGPTEAFTTLPAPAPGRPATRLLIAVVEPRLEALAGRSVRLHYLITRRARVKLSVRRGGRVVATANALAHAGRNAITWNGRVAGRRPHPGRYTVVLEAIRADGQSARDRTRLRITRRSVG